MAAASMAFEPEKLLVDSREAARLLSVCEKTLWTLTNRDGLPCVRLGRAVRYSPADLRAWIEHKSRAATCLT